MGLWRRCDCPGVFAPHRPRASRPVPPHADRKHLGGAQIKTSRLQEAARATLYAHALITLCADVPPLVLSLPKEWGALGFANEGKEIDMGFSRTWLALHSYTSAPEATAKAGVPAKVCMQTTHLKHAHASALQRSCAFWSPYAHLSTHHRPCSCAQPLRDRREQLALQMAQLISRPAGRDRVLDLTCLAEFTPADFAAAALALRHTSMFSGVRLLDLPLGDALAALCDYARTSKSLEVLVLSGVLPEGGRRGAAKALGDALAAGAIAQRLPYVLPHCPARANQFATAAARAPRQLLGA
jgi:hypothetical protein